MINIKEIAEMIINQKQFEQEEFMWLVHNSETLARAYLELEKKHRMLNNAIAIASWNINDYVKQFAKDIIEHSKSDSEITKLKEENEKLKKSREVLRKFVDHCCSWNEGEVVTVRFDSPWTARQAREAIKTDDEIMKGE